MKTSKTVLVEKEIITWKCDLCDFETDHNRGCCGSAPVMKCEFCGKDACREHREAYFENSYIQDYPDFMACEECKPKVDMAISVAKEIAGRYEIWSEVVHKIYDHWDYYQDLLDEDYEPPKEIEPLDISELYES